MPKPSKPKSKAAPFKPAAAAKPVKSARSANSSKARKSGKAGKSAKAAEPVKKSASGSAKASERAAKPITKSVAKNLPKQGSKVGPKPVAKSVKSAAAPAAKSAAAKSAAAKTVKLAKTAKLAKPAKLAPPAVPAKPATPDISFKAGIADKSEGSTKPVTVDAASAKFTSSKPLPKAAVSGATPPVIPLPPVPIVDVALEAAQLDANGNPVSAENRPRPRGLSAMGKAKKPKPKKIELEMPKFESIYKPSGRKSTPLIASGPKNPPQFTAGAGIKNGEKIKPVFNKRDLDKYRVILVKKRAELAGDVESMESEALNQTSGGLSHTPQHVAEQGSDTFDQDNSLRLAQKERELIKEIDDAIKRVDVGSYGVCELMRKPITLERLAELPWTRYCIDGARALERQRSIPGGATR